VSEKGSYYARVLGTFWRHPRTLGLSMAARGLWVSLLSWSADQRSDGGIPAAALTMVCGGKPDARSLSELIVSGLLVSAETSYTLRDWAQHNITRDEHEQAKEATRKRVADHRKRAAVTPDVTRYIGRTNGVTSEQEQEQEQDKRSASADLPDAREASRVPVSEPKAESVTALAERNRRTVAEGYRSRGLAVPRQAASLAGTAEVAASLAGLPPDALPGILARFFEDRRMREKGYPVSYLLTNPNQWATEGPQGRDEGEARERPAATVLPDWLLPKPHPTEAA
jgi:hypothetical protein